MWVVDHISYSVWIVYRSIFESGPSSSRSTAARWGATAAAYSSTWDRQSRRGYIWFIRVRGWVHDSAPSISLSCGFNWAWCRRYYKTWRLMIELVWIYQYCLLVIYSRRLVFRYWWAIRIMERNCQIVLIGIFWIILMDPTYSISLLSQCKAYLSCILTIS